MTHPQPRARRVTFLITSSYGGGAEQQVKALALAFRRRGWDVGVISMLPLDSMMTELRGDGIRVASLGMTRGIPDPRALMRLVRILRRWRPDVLHCHMVHANLLGRLSRLLVRTPVVISTMHNQDEGPQWRYRAYRLTDPLGDLTTTVSLGAVDEAVRRGAVPRSRIRLVRNGIDIVEHRRDGAGRKALRRKLGLADQFLWLAVGRLVDAKAYPDMITAFRRVADVDPSATLLIAGEGPLEDEIQAVIDASGLGDAVHLLGQRPDVPDLMRAADGFVMSSAWEGLPIVLLEASVSELPIVATDVGGSRDAIVDEVSGFITPPANPDVLARAMVTVMTMPPGKRRAMGAAARAHVASIFALESVVDTWQGLYEGLLAARRR